MKSLRFYSVVGYFLMIAALLPLVYFHGVFSYSPFVVSVQTFAVALMVWARITFGTRSFHFAANPTEGGLVTTGPYRLIRHPIYASILYFSLAGVADNISRMNLLLTAVLCLGVGMRIFCEERMIANEYPEYVEYAQRTKRIVPFVF